MGNLLHRFRNEDYSHLWGCIKMNVLMPPPLRCVRISKMQGIEDEGDRSLLE